MRNVTKSIRLLVATSLVAAAAPIFVATPAHACFNPDDPVCPTVRTVCQATDRFAKYRDRVLSC